MTALARLRGTSGLIPFIKASSYAINWYRKSKINGKLLDGEKTRGEEEAEVKAEVDGEKKKS